MYEYLDKLDRNFWQSFAFIILATSAGIYFLTLSMTSFHVKQLKAFGGVNSKIKTTLMSLCQAVVCFIIVSKFFVPLYDENKVATTLIMFFFTYISRYYYWNNLAELFGENKYMRKFYNLFIFFVLSVIIFHLVWFFAAGPRECCLGESVARSSSTSYILNVQIPFKMNPVFTGFVTAFTLSISAVYMRFLYLAIRSRDKVMIFGLSLSVLNVFYTTSYHAFGFEYWIPLYFMVDLIEYSRLQRLEISFFKKQFKEKLDKEKMLLHDIANPLQFNFMRLEKILRKGVDSTSVKDISALYKGTHSAIDIINHHKHKNKNMQYVSAVVNDVRMLFHDTNILFYEPSEDVEVNASVLKNCLINLIKNSIEALGDDLQWIRVIVTNREDGIEIKVVDNGKYKVFKNSLQVFNLGESTKGEGRGTGLYSVKQELEKIGGDISLHHLEGNTCFTILV